MLSFSLSKNQLDIDWELVWLHDFVYIYLYQINRIRNICVFIIFDLLIMSACIEFCGKPKKKNEIPSGSFQHIKNEISVPNSSKEAKLRREELMNKLKHVNVDLGKENVLQPPPSFDMTIDL